MASLVDPRIKDTHIAEDCREFMKTRAVAEFQSLLEVQAATVTEPHTSTEAAAEAVERQSKRVNRSLGCFFKKALYGTAALADRKTIEVKLKSYLQTTQVDGETETLWTGGGCTKQIFVVARLA